MKTLLLTFIIYLFNLNMTDIVGTYQIESKRSGDTLELKKDGTFEYQSRGGSCWTWKDITGTWELKNRILILNHSYSYQEEATKFVEEIMENLDNTVTFEVKDNFGKPIPDFELKYWCDNNQINKTDINGVMKFNKCSKIENDEETVSVGIKYLTHGNETGQSSQVYKKSNHITLSINSEPKTIFKKEKYSFEYTNGKLKSIEFPYVGETSTYKKL